MSELTTAARPYARAVFQHAEQSGDFDGWAQRLQLLTELNGQEKFRLKMASPDTTAAERIGLIKDTIGEQLGPQGVNFAAALVENGRLAQIEEIARIFTRLTQSKSGEITAVVRTAFELTDAQREQLSERLSQRFGSKVKLDELVDESLIGGATIEVDDVVIDGSLLGRLSKMKQALAQQQ